MKTNNRNRRGFTLAELAIVIALIAIVLAMVTSFIVMIDSSRDLSQVKLEAMQNISVAEAIIERFITDAENNGGTVAFEDKCSDSPENEEYYRLKNSEGKILFFDKGIHALVSTANEEGKENTLTTLDTVKDIRFRVISNESDRLYYCTITYDIGGKSTQEYTFCVNPHAGENIN
ncbi:MAG: type II secretion system protein [Clostridia bacterium]|nr:type II secretion system protein [Clostridia bacterium]